MAASSSNSPAVASTPQAASAGAGNGTSLSGKRGLAYNDAALANLLAASCPTCSWGYNWDAAAHGLDSKLSFVPMLWNDDASRTSAWDANVQTALSAGAKAIFSFNEPDNGGQANMLPARAAASHVRYLNKYAGKALVGSPAISNSGLAGEGIQWLKSFMSACASQSEPCHVDFCNVHWYSEAQYASTLFDHLAAAHEVCGGKPIWLTEFAPIAGDAEAFLRSVLPKLDALDYLHAYSYFMVSAGSLMSSAQGISSLGKVYASA